MVGADGYSGHRRRAASSLCAKARCFVSLHGFFGTRLHLGYFKQARRGRALKINGVFYGVNNVGWNYFATTLLGLKINFRSTPPLASLCQFDTNSPTEFRTEFSSPAAAWAVKVRGGGFLFWKFYIFVPKKWF